jgi:hypothetical protein
MAWSNDSKPTGSYTNEDTTAFASWADTEITWASSFTGWVSNGVTAYDSKPSGSYTNDNKPI